MSKFIFASRQAIELDKTRILLEKRIKEVRRRARYGLKWLLRPDKRQKS